MLLLNYGTKKWTKNTQDNKSMAGWTENNKDKKSRALLTLTKKMCPDNFFVDNFFVLTIFLSGQKGIYHQGEFCQMSCNIFMLRKTECKKTYFLEGNDCAPKVLLMLT